MNASVHDRRTLAQQFRKEERWTEAGPIYRELWNEMHDPWDGWGYATCLRKARSSERALAVCDEILVVDPQHDPTLQLAAWCIFDRLKASEHADANTVVAVHRVRQLTEATAGGAYDQYSAYSKATTRAARLFDEAGRYDKVLELLEGLDPTRLDDKPYVDPQGKNQASELEKWHLGRTKALARTGNWESLLAACDAALNARITFHNGQWQWVQFRKARALHQLGRFAEARALLDQLSERSPHPVFCGELGAVHLALGDSVAARGWLARALLAHQDLGPSVRPLQQLAALLERNAENGEIAGLHYALVVAIRDEAGWPVSEELTAACARHASDLREIGALRRALRPHWQQWSDAIATSAEGVIKSLIADGAAGFIAGDDDVDYFFKRSDILEGEPVRGARVVFEPAVGFDRKKDRESPVARRIRLSAAP